jgi:hypothetical protein
MIQATPDHGEPSETEASVVTSLSNDDILRIVASARDSSFSFTSTHKYYQDLHALLALVFSIEQHLQTQAVTPQEKDALKPVLLQLYRSFNKKFRKETPEMKANWHEQVVPHLAKLRTQGKLVDKGQKICSLETLFEDLEIVEQCPVCSETYKDDPECKVTGKCGHSICKKCFKRYLLEKLDKETVAKQLVKCPIPGQCDSLPFSLFQTMFEEDEALSEALRKFQKKDADKIIDAKEFATIQAAGIQYNAGRSDARPADIRACPKCQEIYYRADACTHVTCAKCKHYFTDSALNNVVIFANHKDRHQPWWQRFFCCFIPQVENDDLPAEPVIPPEIDD